MFSRKPANPDNIAVTNYDPFDKIQSVDNAIFVENRRKFDLDECKVHGFIFEENEKMAAAFQKFMELVKKGTASVQTVVLMQHKNAVCQNLFGNKPNDHYHMLVYYSDGKFTDSNT